MAVYIDLPLFIEGISFN